MIGKSGTPPGHGATGQRHSASAADKDSAGTGTGRKRGLACDGARAGARAAVASDGRAHRRRDPASPAVLLRSPRARPLRRILAGLVDIVLIPMIALSFTAQYGLWAMALSVAVIYALNGYLEGWKGQSVGKMLGGLHTIHHATGERIGGGQGSAAPAAARPGLPVPSGIRRARSAPPTWRRSSTR